MGNHRWRRDEIQKLRDIRIRYTAIWAGKRHPEFGKSERKYVIGRFRQAGFGATLSDQAIWAKYRRENNMVGQNPARANVAKAQVVIPDVFQGGKVTLVAGLTTPMVVAMVQAANLDRLGSGVSRTVYAIDDKSVLKVLRDPTYSHNRTEVETYKKFGNTPNGKYLGKVLAADPSGHWLVMEKVRCGLQDTPDAASRAARRMGISDLHRGNFGKRANGTAVVIDYANGW
jgi:hypothetical protein